MALVWYDAWQMECCGDSFSVGDSVTWSLSERPDREWLGTAIGAELAAEVSHVEDHHELEGDAVDRRGTVLSIRRASCRYAPVPGGDERVLYPVAGTTEITPAEMADGREGGRSELPFIGYLVELDLDRL